MQALRSLLLILIAATFAVGGTVRAMPIAAAEPPCHEAPAAPDKHKPTQVAVNCCVGCLPAPSATQAVLAVVDAAPAAYVTVATSAEGRHTAPDPRPPRLQT